MRDSFVFYRSFYEAIKDLPRDVQGEVYTAIMEYGLNGITTEDLKPIARSIFTLIKPLIDRNNAKYENGKKGGRPKSESKPNNNLTITKPKPNDNVNDNVNDNKEILSNESINKNSRFEKFNEWLKEKCPSVAKMESKLTEKEFDKLLEKYSAKEITAGINNMDNSKTGNKTIEKRYKSVYRTFLNWNKKD